MIDHEISIGDIEESTVDSSVIIGAGLAGLATALKIKQLEPDHSVVVIDKPTPEANSLIAGQRFRAGVTGIRKNAPQEMLDLLASRNDGIETSEMIKFATIAERELRYWQSRPDFISFTDKKEWFGPQWGEANKVGLGRGRSVLNWFQKQAQAVGVHFVKADVDRLNLSDDRTELDGVVLGTGLLRRILRASNYIIAAGNAGGYIFDSTNRPIARSGQELLFETGAELTDTTIHMLHPFGRSSTNGHSVLGCFETDDLSEAKVFLDGLSRSPIFDKETTELLRTHEAHYHFPEIARRFQEFGSVVKLELPDGRKLLAKVSHHYSHFGVKTVDGVSLNDYQNAYVAGDTAGIGFWTNHRERFPGFALTKTLVDAALIAESVVQSSREQTLSSSDYRLVQETNLRESRVIESQVRKINSKYLLDWILRSGDQCEKNMIAQGWVDHLNSIGYDTSQVRLSRYIANSHLQNTDNNHVTSGGVYELRHQ